jgi:hypothetical protein
MRNALELSWDRRFTIFQWAVFAGTVGIILLVISERGGLAGWEAAKLPIQTAATPS